MKFTFKDLGLFQVVHCRFFAVRLGFINAKLLWLISSTKILLLRAGFCLTSIRDWGRGEKSTLVL